MKTRILLKVIFFGVSILLASCGEKELKNEKISVKELSTWKTLDKGKSTVLNNELIIEEIDGSDGYFLISPESYEGDLILNYKVKAMSESSVLIVLFSASDKGITGGLTLPPSDTKGIGFWTWRTHLEHYNLTFNNKSHGNRPFFFKNISPRKRGFYQNTAENIMEVGKWYDVEVGKARNKLWFKLNNTIIFEQEDHRPFPNGHVMFRISGTTGEKVVFAKAAIKDLVISHE